MRENIEPADIISILNGKQSGIVCHVVGSNGNEGSVAFSSDDVEIIKKALSRERDNCTSSQDLTRVEDLLSGQMKFLSTFYKFVVSSS